MSTDAVKDLGEKFDKQNLENKEPMNNVTFEEYFKWASTTDYNGPFGLFMKIYVKEGIIDSSFLLFTHNHF